MFIMHFVCIFRFIKLIPIKFILEYMKSEYVLNMTVHFMCVFSFLKISSSQVEKINKQGLVQP